jgi:hypothetical protein
LKTRKSVHDLDDTGKLWVQRSQEAEEGSGGVLEYGAVLTVLFFVWAFENIYL